VSNVQLRKGLEEKGGVGFIVAYGRSGDVAEERVWEREEVLVQLQEDFGFRQSTFE
jgi:hypothetical protein